MLRFPAAGDRVPVPLFTEPRALERGDLDDAAWARVQARQELLQKHAADLAGARLFVRLVDRKTFRAWSYKLDELRALEARRVFALRSADPERLVPGLHDDGYMTAEFQDAYEEWCADVLRGCLLGAEGFTIRGTDVSTVADVGPLVDLLVSAGLGDPAAAKAMNAQTPPLEAAFC